MSFTKPCIVIPTNRPEQFVKWLEVWSKQLVGCHLIIIQDTKEKTLSIDTDKFTYDIYDWNDIDKDLGKDSWIIPRKTDCVRSYGFLKALEKNPIFILTLDDDTEPLYNTIEDHYKTLYTNNNYSNFYYNTMTDNIPRGAFQDFSSVVGRTVISHGVWVGVPDLDAHTQITNYTNSGHMSFNKGVVPYKSYFSMCGMNLAFKPSITKYMYFGLQGNNYPIDRCGDIWAGYYVTQKLEPYEFIKTGYSSVIHNRASNSWSNLVKEQNADKMGLIFRDIFCNNNDLSPRVSNYDYWVKLTEAYHIWERLCNERLPRS